LPEWTYERLERRKRETILSTSGTNTISIYAFVICENYAMFSTAWLGGFLIEKLAGPQFPAARTVCMIVD